MSLDAEQVIRKALEPSIKAETRRNLVAGEVQQALEEAGHLYENGWVSTVEVHHSRVAVETVEVYGLCIRLDAQGRAVDVSSPDGFMITEVPE